MAAFLQLDVSPEHPAMRKFILSADGKYNVRFILIVLQPVSMTRIPLIAEIQRRIRPGESMFYPNSGRIVPVPELSFQLHAQLSGKIIIALRIHMLIKNPRPCFRKRILFHAGILQIDERRNLPGPFRPKDFCAACSEPCRRPYK